MTQEKAGWWADDPIETPRQEGLGRGPFVDRVVALLDEIAPRPSSSVIALVGPWGSGKTSTANLVLQALDPVRWAVGRLNPWALGSADAVMSELLCTIASALPEKATADGAKEKLRRYAAAGAPLLTLIPGIGGVAKDIVAEATKPADDTVQAHFERVRDALAALEQPVMIFVDDVDRLHPDELMALFRAVRVLGRLPYVHYAIAYDQRTIVDLIKETPVARDDEDRALAFLEKIVTVPIDQPVIREEQSAALFTEGIARLLDELEIGVTDELWERLAVEWELLLADDLAQPRGIRRLLAQLRIYLPLLGVGEVDVADYVVVTHLRLFHPRLYRAIRDDRAVLTVPGNSADRARLELWKDGTMVGRAAGEGRQASRLVEAVHRLFPLVADLTVSRLTRCRVEDPDYTDRYFVFGQGDREISDATLLVLTREWAGKGELPSELLWLIDPDLNARQAGHSAGLIRRLAKLAAHLTDDEAARLLSAVVRLMPLPAGSARRSLARPGTALEGLLTSLVAVAADPGVPALIETAYDRGIPAFLSFLNAIPRRNRDASSWQARLTDAAIQRAWRAFRENVELGDAAPDLWAEGLFQRVRRLAGEAAADELLRELVDGGVSVADVAARFVRIDYPNDEIGWVINGLDGDELVHRLGLDRLQAHRADLEVEPATGPEPDNGVSWAGRRRHAQFDLAKIIDAAGDRLPTLPVAAGDPFGGGRLAVLAGAAEGADLLVTASVLTPAGDSVPAPALAATGPTGRQRENLLREALDDSPISDWLRRFAAAGWPVRFTGWQVAMDPGDGRNTTRLTATPEAASGDEPAPSVLAGAVVRTGSANGSTFLRADIAVGLWLSDMEPADRPGAAPRLADLYELLVALTSTLVTEAPPLRRQLTDRPAPTTTVVKLTAEAPRGIDAAVDLTTVERVGRTSGNSLHHAVIPADDAARRSMPKSASDWAVAFLDGWLLGAQYRGYEDTLRRLGKHYAGTPTVGR